MKRRLAAFAATIALAAACGARTGLDVPEVRDAGLGTGGEPAVDAGPDAPLDAPPDAVAPSSCVDAGITYIYVVTTNQSIFSYYPPTASFSQVGTLGCPDQSGAFSMAVDRKGKAYVEFMDNQMFVVDTGTLTCSSTSFVEPAGFTQFGMGFSADVTDPGETLYLASNAGDLASLDTTTFKTSFVGPFSTPLGGTELTGTGNGELYAFGVTSANNVSHLAHVDKLTAQIVSDDLVPLGPGVTDWAFAFWGGKFYFFTAMNGTPPTSVTEWDPTAKTATVVAQLDGLVVGAGVSTCAPE